MGKLKGPCVSAAGGCVGDAAATTVRPLTLYMVPVSSPRMQEPVQQLLLNRERLEIHASTSVAIFWNIPKNINYNYVGIYTPFFAHKQILISLFKKINSLQVCIYPEFAQGTE